MKDHSTHSKTPWKVPLDLRVIDSDELYVSRFELPQDAALTVACVNACSAINPEAPAKVAAVLPELFYEINVLQNMKALDESHLAKLFTLFQKATTK